MDKDMNPYVWWFILGTILTGGGLLFILPLVGVIWVMSYLSSWRYK